MRKALHGASFLTSAAKVEQCPPDTGLEVAFVGRSNSGKSSAINYLTQQKKLAKVSKTPGRTQLINLFEVDEHFRLVDLPGYGFAKVDLKTKDTWNAMMGHYFEQRQCLKGIVIMMDIRHPLTPFDYAMIDYAQHAGENQAGIAVHILLTKADKLSFGKAKGELLKVQNALRKAYPEALISLQLFSSLKRQGAEGVFEFLDALYQATLVTDITIGDLSEDEWSEHEERQEYE